MTVAEITESVQSQVLDALKQYQDLLVEAVRGAAETVEEIVPVRPELPFANQLPRPTELAGNVFDFAEKLLANRHQRPRRGGALRGGQAAHQEDGDHEVDGGLSCSGGGWRCETSPPPDR